MKCGYDGSNMHHPLHDPIQPEDRFEPVNGNVTIPSIQEHDNQTSNTAQSNHNDGTGPGEMMDHVDEAGP